MRYTAETYYVKNGIFDDLALMEKHTNAFPQYISNLNLPASNGVTANKRYVIFPLFTCVPERSLFTLSSENKARLRKFG